MMKIKEVAKATALLLLGIALLVLFVAVLNYAWSV